MIVKLLPVLEPDIEELTKIQIRTFLDDNQRKPPGCSLEGPPGYDSITWNKNLIGETPYYKIISVNRIVGGIILFQLGDNHIEVGRIWVDPAFQNKGIGQSSMAQMFFYHPEVKRWTLGTPKWALRNQYFYEKAGFKKIGETDVDPALGWAGIEYELIR